MPTPSLTVSCTNEWIRKDDKYGPYSSEDLRDEYTSQMAGEWIRNGIPTQYAIVFILPDGIGYKPSQINIYLNQGEFQKMYFRCLIIVY